MGQQAKHGENGGEGECAGDAETAVVGIEKLDFAREGVGFAGEVLGDDADGAEFSHGAGVAENDAVEEAPFDVGEGDAPEGLPAIGAQRDGGLFFLGALFFHEGNEFAGDEGEGDEDGGEDHAGEGEDDVDVVGDEPWAEAALAAEEEDEDESGDNGRDGEGDVDEGGEEGFAAEVEFGDGPCGGDAEDRVQGDGDGGDEEGHLDGVKGIVIDEGSFIGGPTGAEGFVKHREEGEDQEYHDEEPGDRDTECLDPYGRAGVDAG